MWKNRYYVLVQGKLIYYTTKKDITKVVFLLLIFSLNFPYSLLFFSFSFSLGPFYFSQGPKGEIQITPGVVIQASQKDMITFTVIPDQEVASKNKKLREKYELQAADRENRNDWLAG